MPTPLLAAALLAATGAAQPLFTLHMSVRHDTWHTGGAMGAVELHWTTEADYELVMREDPLHAGAWGPALCNGTLIDLLAAVDEKRPFCVRLRYKRGSARVTGRSGRETAAFRVDPGTAVPDPVLGNPDGMISSDGTSVRIALSTAPGFAHEGGAGDEIFDCPYLPPAAEQGLDDFRRLAAIEKDERPDPHAAFDCPGRTTEHLSIRYEGALGVTADLSNTKRSIERGATLLLDGTASRGPIKRWRWTTVPVCGYGRPRQVEGPTHEFALLCATRVKLEVDDGRRTHSDALVVEVTPRERFRTPFETDDTAVDLRQSCTPLRCLLGRNFCADDDWESPNDWIHFPAGSTTWEGPHGYDVARVPSGPFEGLWFVAESRLHAARKVGLNTDLLKTGEGSIADRNAGDAQRAADFARLVESVREHERQHGLIAREALSRSDPAREIEGLVKGEREALVVEADRRVRAMNQAMIEASTDEAVKARLRANPAFVRGAKVWRRNDQGTFELWVIPSLAELGENP